jgi:cysteinyl-tRNA synthetase
MTDPQPIRLFNTLTRTEEPFAPARDNTVRMYSCGLTTYARGHIGNFRTFVAVDLLRRALKYQHGFAMRHVMNFTDVDDRTILESQKAGLPLREYTDQYVQAYREDAAALGIEAVEESPRATDAENIAAMGETIKALETRGHTYRSDGSIYFKIATLPDYGKLARLDHAGIKSGARIDSDKYDKENARDFVLWKATKEGEPTWDPGIGPGRPGWHIECSAMALRLLGEPPLDIHAGGVDLIFPHHENEIAQSEGATGTPFSRVWVHVEHLMIEEAGKTDKMSKSLGNVYNLADVVEQGFRPSALRYLYLGVHYRKQLRFSWKAMAQAEEALKRLTDFLARLDSLPAGRSSGEPLAARLKEAHDEFAAHISADLNAPAALGVVFDLVRALNASIDAGELGADDAAAVRATFEQFDKVLGVLSLRQAEDRKPPVPVDEIEQLVAARQEARRARNFAEADRIRKDLDARGIVLEDTGGATRWKRK